jgi:hypothetical protein
MKNKVEGERREESKTCHRGQGRPPKIESVEQRRRQEKALVEELVELLQEVVELAVPGTQSLKG